MTFQQVRTFGPAIGVIVAVISVLAFIWAAAGEVASHVSDEEHERELSEAIEDIPATLSKEQFDTFWRQYRLDVNRYVKDQEKLENEIDDLEQEVHRSHEHGR